MLVDSVLLSAGLWRAIPESPSGEIMAWKKVLEI